MKVVAINISEGDAAKLMAATNRPNIVAAINAAIRFALQFDEADVREALK